MAEIVTPVAAAARARPLSRRARARLLELFALSLIVLGAVPFLAPFFWMISTSLKEPKLVYLFPPQIVPNPVKWDNYPIALTRLPFALFAWNTIQITALAGLGSVLTASLCAFGFARLRFVGRDVWFLVLLGTIMLPGQVTPTAWPASSPTTSWSWSAAT